jgi:hypothetical protein
MKRRGLPPTSDAGYIRKWTGAMRADLHFQYREYARQQVTAKNPILSRAEWTAGLFRQLAADRLRRDPPASSSSQKHDMAPATPACSLTDDKLMGVDMPHTHRETAVCHRDNSSVRSARRPLTAQGITASLLPDV